MKRIARFLLQLAMIDPAVIASTISVTALVKYMPRRSDIAFDDRRSTLSSAMTSTRGCETVGSSLAVENKEQMDRAGQRGVAAADAHKRHRE